MSWHREVVDTNRDELVANNSHQLAVMLWQKACEDYLHEVERHAGYDAAVKQQLTEAQRIGLAIQQAHANGRKTIRISDLIISDPR